MEEDLQFEFPLSDKKVLEIEKMIKTYLRKYSINLPGEKDIERYTDKYNESVLVTNDELKNYIYSDILSSEISHFLGMENRSNVNNVIDKVNIEETGSDSVINDLDNYESSEIDDDYRIEASNDEDSVSTKNEDDGGYF